MVFIEVVSGSVMEWHILPAPVNITPFPLTFKNPFKYTITEFNVEIKLPAPFEGKKKFFLEFRNGAPDPRVDGKHDKAEVLIINIKPEEEFLILRPTFTITSLASPLLVELVFYFKTEQRPLRDSYDLRDKIESGEVKIMKMETPQPEFKKYM